MPALTKQYGNAPEPEKRIEMLYLWIAIHPNGAEGIIAADLEVMPGVIRHTPLMNSRRDGAEAMRSIAIGLGESSDPPVRVELRAFARVDTQ